MDVKITVRVAAYIIRPDSHGRHELLLFKHPDCDETPIQVPGGGVEPQESIESALHREIFEESGLQNLTIVRKLGMTEHCWIKPRKLISQRHCFLLRPSQPTTDTWDHIVQGEGFDAGMCFSYFWHRPSLDFRLHASFGSFLHPDQIPELFDCT